MTDDSHLVFAELVFTGEKRPSQCRFGAEHLEVAGRDEAPRSWTGSVPPVSVTASPVCADMKSKTVLSLPVEEVQRRDPVALAPRRLLHDADDAIGVGVGERLQQHRVHEAEDRCIGANADGEGQDRDGREPRTLTEVRTE